MSDFFSFSRWLGIVGKEFIQLKRDRLTFGMIVGIPIIQLVLFGFAINSDPKRLPTMLLDADRSEFSRSIVSALANSNYFAFIGVASGEDEADRALATGRTQFVVSIPTGFARALMRGERPEVLVEADATDPTATQERRRCAQRRRPVGARPGSHGSARGARSEAGRVHDGRAPALQPRSGHPVQHRPGLMGVILTMTMVLMTGLAITREQERGTMENLLSTPATALEVMTGKIVPYVMIGSRR
jgi:ABC-2 type transport system permease protein